MNPLEQAEDEIPYKWYEVSNRQLIISTVLSAVALSQLYNVIPEEYKNALLLASSFAYVTGVILDRYSTVKSMKSINIAKSHGISAETGEDNLIIRGETDPNKFMRNPKVLAIEILGLAFTIFNPGIGVAYAGNKFVASMNNLRVAKRYELADKFAQNNP
jgi:hypothetical protein